MTDQQQDPNVNDPPTPEAGSPTPEAGSPAPDAGSPAPDVTGTTLTPSVARAIAKPPTAPIAPIGRQPGAGTDWTGPGAPMWSSHESTTEASTAPVAAVTPLPAPRRSRGRFRWAIALVVVALVAGAASAAFLSLAGGGSASTVAQWAPTGSLLYLETRMDLPGDQHAALGTFLSAFPGFADQSTLDAKLAELYDRIVRGDTNATQDYSTNIKPWFGGQVALVLPTVPAMATDGTASKARAAVIVSVSDAAKAGAWLATLPGASGATTATYGGITLALRGDADHQYAYGVDGPILVLGDVQSVHDVIDTKGSGGLAASDGFKRALAAYHGDHLAFAYGDVKGLIDAAQKANPQAATTFDQVLLAKLPAWFATSVHADGNNLVVDVAEPSVAGSPGVKDHTSSLAGHLPASTILEMETHDLGTSITNALKAYADSPAYKDGLKAVTDALDRVGGIDSFTSWLGDATVAVTRDGATYGGGVVIALPDDKSADTARGKLASLKNLASLAGAGTATVTDATYNGATITTIDFGDLSKLAPGASLPGGLGGGKAAVSFTLSNGLVVFGVGGDGFVKAVLDTKAGSSLADQARYKTAIDAVGGANVSQGYLDLRAVIDAVVSQLPADQKAKYDSDVRPYLDPLQSLSLAGHAGDVQHAVSVLTVGK